MMKTQNKKLSGKGKKKENQQIKTGTTKFHKARKKIGIVSLFL